MTDPSRNPAKEQEEINAVNKPTRAKIAAKLLAVAEQRGTEKSTCPSEIARMLFPIDWRLHMGAVVSVALKLHHQKKVVITQKGKTIDLSPIKGPIRIKTV